MCPSDVRDRDGNDNLRPSPPWWQWPNILSLDAPLIAGVWQEAFARSFGVTLTLSERAVLVLVVWCVYAADHVADGLRLGAPAGAAARHRFALRHCRSLAVAVGLAGAAALVLSLRLPPRALLSGAVLAGATGAYFLWNQCAGTRFGRLWAKETVVGCVFAAGCALVPISLAPASGHLPVVLAFALVCVANCLLIARLDRERDIRRGERSLAVRLSPRTRPARIVALAAVVVALSSGPPGLAAPILLSAVGLWFGATIERLRGPDAAAAWVDGVLLSPLCFFGWLL